MKKVIIFGNGDFARLMKYYIDNDTDWIVECFTTESDYINEKEFLGVPLIPFEDLEKNYCPSNHQIILGIGYSNMNKKREEIFYKCKRKGYFVSNYIHSSSLVQTDFIGEGTIILENTLVQPFAKIGVANLIWCNVAIAHDDIIGDFNTLAGSTSLCGFVTIKNNCYLGNRCMVFDHITLEDYTLVGAGADVKKNSNKYDVIVPAKSIVLENRKSIDFI